MLSLPELHKALKQSPLTDNQIRGMFSTLNEDGWKVLEIYFAEKDRDYIAELFCRIIGEKDET